MAKEMVWLCNYGSNAILVDSVPLSPWCCAGFPVEVIKYPAIAKLVQAGSVGVASGYFEGQMDETACPAYANFSEAMMYAVSGEIGYARDALPPEAQQVVSDLIEAGTLAGMDGVKAAAKAAKAAIPKPSAKKA